MRSSTQVLTTCLILLVACAVFATLYGIRTKPAITPRANAPIPEPPPINRPEPTEHPLFFTDIAAQAGLTIPHFSAADGRFRLVESMGGGVGLIDIDKDGFLDIVIAQGTKIPADPADISQATQLYYNNRDGTFKEIAGQAGLDYKGYAQGIAVGDYDGDGYDDLYISGFNAAGLFRFDAKKNRFVETTNAAGLSRRGWQTSCAFADLDGDGDLDLYVVGYLANTVDANGNPTVNCNALPETIGYCPPSAFSPEPDILYRNNGDGTFTDVSIESGISKADGNGLGLAIADFDDDGKLDIFVANDKTPNLLFHNLGHLHFEEVGLLWGAAYNESGDALAGMGVAAGDHDSDGRTDLLVTNFYEEGVTLYRNAAPGRFEIATTRARLKAPTRSKLGFGTGFHDFDNDGLLDLFITNGHINDVRPIRMPFRMPPQVFRNTGDGRFSDVTTSAGNYARELWLGRGAAFGDIDNDGDIDAVVTHLDAPPGLLRNDTPNPGNSLKLTLVPANKGTKHVSPIGVKVLVSVGSTTLTREIVGGTSYLSRSDPRLIIGIGAANEADRVEVRWLSGTKEIWTHVPTDRPVVLAEGNAPKLGNLRDK